MRDVRSSQIWPSDREGGNGALSHVGSDHRVHNHEREDPLYESSEKWSARNLDESRNVRRNSHVSYHGVSVLLRRGEPVGTGAGPRQTRKVGRTGYGVLAQDPQRDRRGLVVHGVGDSEVDAAVQKRRSHTLRQP